MFLGKDLFWGAKKRGSTGEVDVCCSPQPPEALEDPVFENLNRLSKSANMKMFRSSSVSAPLLSGFGRQ